MIYTNLFVFNSMEKINHIEVIDDCHIVILALIRSRFRIIVTSLSMF